MIRPLRKRHLQIWILLAVALPVGIVSGWQAVRPPVKDPLLQPMSTTIFPLLLQKIEKTNYAISLRSMPDTSSLQLEWLNTTELPTPTAIIYQTKKQDDNIEGAAIIGRIEGRGNFRFLLKADSSGHHLHFVLYDIIHHQVIDRINFK